MALTFTEIFVAAWCDAEREAKKIMAHDAEAAAIPHIHTLNLHGDCECGAHYTPLPPKRLGRVRSE